MTATSDIPTVSATDPEVVATRQPAGGLRAPIARTIWLWTASILAVSGLLGLAGVVATLHLTVDVGLAVAALASLLVMAAIGGQVAVWGLVPLLAAPADTLLALERIETEMAAQTGTERRKVRHGLGLQARFADLNETVVRSAHERNGRINELVRALDAARAEGEARAGFFAGMSHELRTPLNAIIGYAMLLSEDAAEAGDMASAKDLDRILQSGRRLLRLINDILDLSRMDAGTLSVDRGAVDVVALMDSVAEGLRDEAKRSGARINLSVSQNGRVMLGDTVRLRQCLNTLLGHVVQCNPGREIVLEAALVPERPDHIQFRIQDQSGRLGAEGVTGVSADAPALSVMDADTLVATVVAKLAHLMSGEFISQVERDGSSSLVLILPLSPDGEAGLRTMDVADIADTDNGVGAVEGGSEPRLVLVIDDDEPTIDLLRRWMHKQGYGVISASNGAQGLALARSRRPDLIILDIFMPGQSGYEVLAALKADDVLRNTPVIVASSDDNRRLGLEAGAAEVMVKPLSRDRLRDVLDLIGEQVGGDILVVDDDPNVREMVHRYASQAGMSVRVAENGAEGLAFARRQTPGAIVLDLCMPDTDGFQMMQALAADTTLSRVPVMVLSQLDISIDEHTRIREAGHVFHPKWKSSPLQIVQNIKTMVAR